LIDGISRVAIDPAMIEKVATGETMLPGGHGRDRRDGAVTAATGGGAATASPGL
jgi:hypothetical protein